MQGKKELALSLATRRQRGRSLLDKMDKGVNMDGHFRGVENGHWDQQYLVTYFRRGGHIRGMVNIEGFRFCKHNRNSLRQGKCGHFNGVVTLSAIDNASCKDWYVHSKFVNTLPHWVWSI